ncbi:MAG: nuclear transport factor 2 family protein [Candidatus Thorarchaeota archaeon]
MRNDSQVGAEIKSLLEDFAKAYPKDDIDKYLSFWAKDENLVVFGTGEKWVGYEGYKPAPQKDKDRFEDISLSYDWMKIDSFCSVAWVAMEVTVRLKIGSDMVSLPARMSGVLLKTGAEWQIVQGHISFPAEP